MMRCEACVIGVGLLVSAAAAVAGVGAITPLVLEGQDVPGIGVVTSIDNFAINNLGQWIVEVDTDNADTNADGVLIRDGVAYLREGAPLAAPAGTAIDSFDSITLNDAGESGWNFFLSGATPSTDSGIFLGDALLIQESTISAAPQFSPGTPYIGFFEAKINNSSQMMLMASIDDPAIGSTVDRALVRLALNPDGTLAGESVLYKEGDVLPGQREPVADFLTGPHNFAFNDNGQTMFVANLFGDTTRDMAVYVDATRIAQEGEPSPVAGRNWAGLGSSRVHLNNFGQFAYTGTLSGDTASDAVIVSSAGVVAQEGDPFGTFFTLTGFGTGPVFVTNQGRVVWYGVWDNSATNNEGIFLDHSPFVIEGETTIDGVLVQTLRGIQDGYSISPNGRYIVFEALLADGREGAFQIEIEACPGNINGDPMANLTDLALLLPAFGACSGDANYFRAADTNFSGCIDLSDLAALLAMFGAQCP
jgi:hypothetical protein